MGRRHHARLDAARSPTSFRGTSRTTHRGAAYGATTHRGTAYRGKRVLDLFVVALGALPAGFVVTLGAILVKLTSRGPAFFLQDRTGLGGETFRVVKLRTMRHDPAGNPVFPDPVRITRVGRFLRRTSIDELPQLLNVARGEMSVVGPRPTLPYQVARYTERQRARLDVRPGLTGLAQVAGRNGMSWGERIELDLEYRARQSLGLDLSILGRTVAAVLHGSGVDGHPVDDPIAAPAGPDHAGGGANPAGSDHFGGRDGASDPIARARAATASSASTYRTTTSTATTSTAPGNGAAGNGASRESVKTGTASTSSTSSAPRIRLAAPDVGEEELSAVARVLASGILTNGPETAAFEAAFARRHGVEHAVAFANGTVALNAVYLACGIGPHDEVVVPSMTFFSSASSVLHVGARPVFCDVDPETFNLDPADVARRITRRTKAVLAVHYGGQPADLDDLRALTTDAGVTLLEDAAEAAGATYRGIPVGGLGRAGMFSFTPTKNITTGEGGMVTTHDGDLAGRLRLLRNHGQSGPDRHVELGHNWRMTEMQAAMGLAQLEKLDAILARKRANVSRLEEMLGHLEGLRLPVVRADRTHTYMIYTVVLPSTGIRDRLLRRLRDAGIEARVYFPPAHRQPVFRARLDRLPSLPVTEALAGRMLSLPFHSRLQQAELEELASTVQEIMVAAR